MKSKILNIPQPPVTSYPAIANTMSILWTNKMVAMPWISDHFIQLLGRKTTHTRYQLHGTFHEAELGYNKPIFLGCPLIETSRVERTIMGYPKFDILSYVRFCIEQNSYIHMCLDRYYISSTEQYQKKHHLHSILIFGYDDKHRCIHARDFLNNKYVDFEISYKDFRNSYRFLDDNTTKDYQKYISVLKYKPYSYRFNLNKMIRNYREYLSGTDSSNVYADDPVYSDLSFSMGIRYYDVLEHLLHEDAVDIRPFHVLCDHKVLQQLRIRYLIQNDYLKNSSSVEELAESIKNKSTILKNIALKRNITPSTPNTKIIELCKELKEEDRFFVSTLLSNISV